ncbi:MAG: hypothetical protein NVS3B5_12320 [Sphingomicrobium sp.]
MTSTNDIRRSFLDYFGTAGHARVPSAPLVPHNDPTLMFVNAGMVPFKNVFTGLETRPYATATSSQKCVRAGGKHNDLDNVGYTARHHTFFEMLGNFSFGDYFKEQAIDHAWTLLTREWGLAPDRLTITVYHTDDEAASLWKRIAGLPDERIVRIATKDNFWAMGDDGPSGPCSEIFYDHGDHMQGGPPGSPDEDGDRFVEIWNLVFMQHEQVGGEIVSNLPRPSIDTGMGLERIAAVMQGVHDNYDTDTFKALIAESEALTHTRAEGSSQASHRVIADHLRASGFLVADGVLPSNEGRGYVLRRIMRRAMRHAHLLGAAEPLMHRLVAALVAEMGAAYPELLRAQPAIESEVNGHIRDNQPVTTRLMTPDDAIEAGAMALFGEKYGDEVRVLSMGKGDAADYSIELCGGTHVTALGDIALFKIISESAVSSGVRRIEALTGEAARLWLLHRDQRLREAANILKASPDEVPARLAALVENSKRLDRDLAEARRALAMGGGAAKTDAGPEQVAGHAFLGKIVDGLDPKSLRAEVDAMKQRLGGAGIAALIVTNDGRASVAVGVTEGLAISAVDLVKVAVATLGGQGGGGRPDMAQGGGPDGAKSGEALAAIRDAIARVPA